MCLHEDTEVDVCFDEDTAHELVTILGNLIENALDAVKHSARKEVMLALSTDASGLYMEIEDSGPGIPKGNSRDVICARRFHKGGGSRFWLGAGTAKPGAVGGDHSIFSGVAKGELSFPFSFRRDRNGNTIIVELRD